MKLRPAEDKDAIKLFNWKNEEDVRRYSILTHSIIKWDNHVEWLRNNIKNIQIITDGETDYGDIRIEDDEIAIKLAKEHRGKGIGKKVIEMVKYPGMKAKIVKGNEPSMKLFTGAGFKVKDFKKGIYYLEYEGDPIRVRGE